MSGEQDLKIILEKVLALPVSDLERYGIVLDGKTPQTMTKLELMTIQLVEDACTGNRDAIKEIFDRLIGRPTQHVTKQVHVQTYHDFLMQIVHQDELDKPTRPEIIHVTPEPPKPKELPQKDKTSNPLLDDLME